jgi:hypothetical protein
MTEEPKDEKQTTRETMDKIYAMSPEELSQFLGDNFRRMCSRPLPNGMLKPGENNG